MNIDPWDPEVAKEWLRTATYEQLLRKWRFEPVGSPWLTGEVGDFFYMRFQKARNRVSVQEAIRISKEVGWDSLNANRGRYDDRRN